MAYKSADEILQLIRPTVEILSIVRQKLNIKDRGCLVLKKVDF